MVLFGSGKEFYWLFGIGVWVLYIINAFSKSNMFLTIYNVLLLIPIVDMWFSCIVLQFKKRFLRNCPNCTSAYIGVPYRLCVPNNLALQNMDWYLIYVHQNKYLTLHAGLRNGIWFNYWIHMAVYKVGIRYLNDAAQLLSNITVRYLSCKLWCDSPFVVILTAYLYLYRISKTLSFMTCKPYVNTH